MFEPGATQDDVVQYSGIKRLIEMAVEGFSCTAFCYGQTGSGKTRENQLVKFLISTNNKYFFFSLFLDTLTGPPELVNINMIKNKSFHNFNDILFFPVLWQTKSTS